LKVIKTFSTYIFNPSTLKVPPHKCTLKSETHKEIQIQESVELRRDHIQVMVEVLVSPLVAFQEFNGDDV